MKGLGERPTSPRTRAHSLTEQVVAQAISNDDVRRELQRAGVITTAVKTVRDDQGSGADQRSTVPPTAASAMLNAPPACCAR